MNKLKKLLALAGVMMATAAAFGQVYDKGLVDKTIAVVGNDVILLSDIESEVQMMRANGQVPDRNTRCDLLESMLVTKLFLTQARLDSLEVTDSEVEQQVNMRLTNVIATLGSEEAAEEYFKKPIYKLKQEWNTVLKEQMLTQKMQQSVVGTIPNLTPSDIKNYFEATPEEDLPLIPTQYRIRQICVYPDKAAAATAVKERLLSLRERIIAGEKFSTLARIYSQDPGSATKGGELGMAPKSVFWPVFSDAAMALKVGQVSQIVETPDGFHIIQMIEKNGDMFNARHILIKPEYTNADRTKAFNRLDSIRTKILDSTITFEIAALNFSEDTKSRTNGGLMADENTGSALFEKDQLKPTDYAILKDMKVGDVSEPFESTDNEGRNGTTIYKILKLEKLIPSHVANFENNFSVLVDELNAKNSQEVLDKFINEKIESTFIRIDPLMQGCEFQREGWIKTK